MSFHSIKKTKDILRRLVPKKNITRRDLLAWLHQGCPEDLAKDRNDLFSHDFDSKAVPIFIISFNRLSYLKSMLQFLESKGFSKIYIIDNASDYPPLLEYYKTIPYKVFFMEKNYGHRVFWLSDIFVPFRKDFYVVTDPDVIPVEECPDDFLDVFYRLLKKYPVIQKVGFSLKIDDLPQGKMQDTVASWEKQFYRFRVPQEKAFIAHVDTTFALYLPDRLVLYPEGKDIRTAYPYQARHLPWYVTHPDSEDLWYSQNRTNGYWDPVVGATEEARESIDLK